MQHVSEQIEFTKAINASLKRANELFGTNFSLLNVEVDFNIKGRCAGRAYPLRYSACKTKYRLSFNMEAILKYNQNMTKDTIPHEVAHLVCFAQPIRGKNHDAGWKRVCRMLGGDDSRTHDMVLTKHREKQRVRFIYEVLGHEVVVGPVHHKRIQSGQEYTIRHPKHGKTRIYASDWKDGAAKVKVSDNASWQDVDVNQAVSKQDRAKAIYKATKGQARKDVIARFVSEVGMTPAGAATYYQNFKKAGL